MLKHTVTLESPTSIDGISSHRTVTIWAHGREQAKQRAVGKCKKLERPVHAKPEETREWQW